MVPASSVTVCGLMSGTSADGIDVAIVRITATDPPGRDGADNASHNDAVPAAFRLLRFAEVPWSPEDRKVGDRCGQAVSRSLQRDVSVLDPLGRSSVSLDSSLLLSLSSVTCSCMTAYLTRA